MMEALLEEYRNDPRTPCRFGFKCYQKNPVHHEKFKHPPKQGSKAHVGNPAKKPRLSDDENSRSPSKETNGRRQSDSPKKSPVKDSPKKSPIKNSPEKPTESTSKAEVKEAVSDSDSDSDAETETVDETTLSDKEFIKRKFLVDMPEDFFSFWSFCKTLNEKEPQNALKAFDLVLVGPYDVLSGALRKCKNLKPEDYLVHWRYYYDPPEFQTIIKGDDKKQFHFGYMRDDPKKPPVFVASNKAADNCTIKPVAENIFGAVNNYLELSKAKLTPFAKMKVPAVQKALEEWAKNHDFSLGLLTPKMVERNKNVVAQTFHRAGIVVPYNKKTELGYRRLQLTDTELKSTLRLIVDATTDLERTGRFEKLQTVITWASIALDECDFGTGLELAIDLFCYGSDLFSKQCLQMFKASYALLGRQEFISIIQAHLKNRKHTANLSVIKH